MYIKESNSLKSENFKLQAKSYKLKASLGFTLTELLVVIAIMGLFLSLVLANYAGQRGVRDLRIAQNELATNVRKVQSFSASSRDTANGSVKYYVLKLDKASNNGYDVQAILSNLQLEPSLERINLPADILISNLKLEQPYGSRLQEYECVQIAFALPFNKVYIDPNCTIDLTVRDPVGLTSLSNSLLRVTLYSSQANTTRQVVINGVSGAITMEQP
jgi:prepilin-type N-terminal cleavage/methylation domain-containing protein